MGKKLLQYIKFTNSELKNFIEDPTSCIECVNHKIHMALPPYGLSDVKSCISDIFGHTKVGFYDKDLNGIVLDVKNIKIINSLWPIRYDSPELHIDVVSNFYVFKPVIGTIIEGIVNHIAKTHIGVIIYRVFNVSIILNDKYTIEKSAKIKFKIKKFDLENYLPYIEGELIEDFSSNVIKFNDDDDLIEHIDEFVDSGIEENKLNVPVGKNEGVRAKKILFLSDNDQSDGDDDNNGNINFNNITIKQEKLDSPHHSEQIYQKNIGKKSKNETKTISSKSKQDDSNVNRLLSDEEDIRSTIKTEKIHGSKTKTKAKEKSENDSSSSENDGIIKHIKKKRPILETKYVKSKNKTNKSSSFEDSIKELIANYTEKNISDNDNGSETPTKKQRNNLKSITDESIISDKPENSDNTLSTSSSKPKKKSKNKTNKSSSFEDSIKELIAIYTEKNISDNDNGSETPTKKQRNNLKSITDESIISDKPENSDNTLSTSSSKPKKTVKNKLIAQRKKDSTPNERRKPSNKIIDNISLSAPSNKKPTKNDIRVESRHENNTKQYLTRDSLNESNSESSKNTVQPSSSKIKTVTKNLIENFNENHSKQDQKSINKSKSVTLEKTEKMEKIPARVTRSTSISNTTSDILTGDEYEASKTFITNNTAKVTLNKKKATKVKKTPTPVNSEATSVASVHLTSLNEDKKTDESFVSKIPITTNASKIKPDKIDSEPKPKRKPAPNRRKSIAYGEKVSKISAGATENPPDNLNTLASDVLEAEDQDKNTGNTLLTTAQSNSLKTITKQQKPKVNKTSAPVNRRRTTSFADGLSALLASVNEDKKTDEFVVSTAPTTTKSSKTTIKKEKPEAKITSFADGLRVVLTSLNEDETFVSKPPVKTKTSKVKSDKIDSEPKPKKKPAPNRRKSVAFGEEVSKILAAATEKPPDNLTTLASDVLEAKDQDKNSDNTLLATAQKTSLKTITKQQKPKLNKTPASVNRRRTTSFADGLSALLASVNEDKKTDEFVVSTAPTTTKSSKTTIKKEKPEVKIKTNPAPVSRSRTTSFADGLSAFLASLNEDKKVDETFVSKTPIKTKTFKIKPDKIDSEPKPKRKPAPNRRKSVAFGEEVSNSLAAASKKAKDASSTSTTSNKKDISATTKENAKTTTKSIKKSFDFNAALTDLVSSLTNSNNTKDDEELSSKPSTKRKRCDILDSDQIFEESVAKKKKV